ncbi:MAG: hypothetical protein J4G03_02820 [Gemmatimonadetes bacterium]|nr:hypothetical protein [Gemmatimonadota bacterium]
MDVHKDTVTIAVVAEGSREPVLVKRMFDRLARKHKVFKRLAFRTNNQIAAVAVARELVGFVWVLMQESVTEIEAQRRAA